MDSKRVLYPQRLKQLQKATKIMKNPRENEIFETSESFLDENYEKLFGKVIFETSESCLGENYENSSGKCDFLKRLNHFLQKIMKNLREVIFETSALLTEIQRIIKRELFSVSSLFQSCFCVSWMLLSVPSTLLCAKCNDDPKCNTIRQFFL